MDFAVPADFSVKIKESEKRNKYLDLAEKKLWNVKVTVIPFVIGALRTIPKRLVKGQQYTEIRGKTKSIKTTVLLRSTRILRRVLET